MYHEWKKSDSWYLEACYFPGDIHLRVRSSSNKIIMKYPTILVLFVYDEGEKEISATYLASDGIFALILAASRPRRSKPMNGHVSVDPRVFTIFPLGQSDRFLFTCGYYITVCAHGRKHNRLGMLCFVNAQMSRSRGGGCRTIETVLDLFM